MYSDNFNCILNYLNINDKKKILKVNYPIFTNNITQYYNNILRKFIYTCNNKLKYYYIKNKKTTTSSKISDIIPQYLKTYSSIDSNSPINQIAYIMSDNNVEEYITKWDKKALIDTMITIQFEFNPNRTVYEYIEDIYRKINKCYHYYPISYENNIITSNQKKILEFYLNTGKPIREIMNIFTAKQLSIYGI